MELYVRALVAELRLRINEIRGNRISTIYIGGGTPSILPAPLLTQLIEGILNQLTSANALNEIEEFTIEANPDDISADVLNLYNNLGINRVSIGVQTFDDQLLSYLGRKHNSSQARNALELLSSSGFNYSADLIYGLPDQGLYDWQAQLSTLLSYEPPHFSSYLLSYEAGTRLYARLVAGKVEEASEELATSMYDHLISIASSAGYEHYEISNFSRPGKAAVHNSNYWNLTPYLGLGVSAHSFDGLDRRSNPPKINTYIDSILAGKPYCEVEEETDDDRLNDLIITSLRTSQGLDMNLLKQFPERLQNEFAENLKSVGSRIYLESNRLKIPEDSWLRSDAIFRDLIL